MAINPEQDDNKQRKKSRFKKFRKIALPAVASLGLLSGGSYFNNEFNHASDRLIELSNEYAEINRDWRQYNPRLDHEREILLDEMDKYTERIVSKDSIASIFKLAAETDNILLMHKMLYAIDEPDDVTWQTRFGKGDLARKTYDELADELILIAYENGSENYLRKFMKNSSISEDVITEIFRGFIQTGNFEAAQRILFHTGLHYQIEKLFDNESVLTDEQHKFIVYNFNENGNIYREFLLKQYIKNGYLNRAQDLIMQVSDPEKIPELYKIYLEFVSDRGNVEEMIAASIFVGFSSDEEIVDFAVTAAEKGHYEAAEQLIKRFDLDMNDYFKELWSYVVRNQDEQAAIHLLNKFHELGGDEAVLGVFQPSSNGAFGRFAFNIAKDIGLKLQPASQEALASLFSGTMDDHLRLHWQQGEAAHDTPRQIAPAPRP